MKKIIIGLVGEIASGKDTVADYLVKKYRAQKVSFSQPLRDTLERLHLPQTRENLMKLGVALRQTYGQDLLSKVIVSEVEQARAKIIILPNVRLESDLVYLKDQPGFILIGINTDPKIRYQRLTQRNQNLDDQTKTWKQFQADQKLSTEIHIKKIAKKAKYQIDNNGNLPQLYQQLETLIKQLG